MALALPGWNSLAAASRWHRGFEIAGFVALGLLLLFEILAYLYGNRRDTLNVQFELAAAQIRLQQEQLADQKRDAEIVQAQRQAAEAKNAQQAAQEKIDQLTATRTLSGEQRGALIKSLSVYKSADIIILNANGSKECQDYADQFREVFKVAGWVFPRPKFRYVTHEGEGLKILVKDLTKAPVRALAIQEALKSSGIEAPGGVDETIDGDAVELYIGFRTENHSHK